MDTLKTREDFTRHIKSRHKNGYIQESTRSVILSMTFYDIPTRFYTNINIILEISAAGFYNPSILEIRPFTIPFKDPQEKSVLTIYFFRWALCIGWVILVLITWLKKGSVQQLLTWQTFRDTSISLFVLSL